MDLKVQDQSPFEQRILDAVNCPPRPGESRLEVRDDEDSGLILRVSSTGHAAWYVYVWDAVAKAKRAKKLADFSTLRLEDARRKACDKREQVALMTASGKSFVEQDIADQEEKKVQKDIAVWTLKKCYEEYLSANPHLKPRSVNDYRKAIFGGRNAPEILEQPVALLTKPWVVERFKTIYARSISQAWKWWAAMHAILWLQFEVRPHVFRDNGFPIPKKDSMGATLKRVGRKSKRIRPQDLPLLKTKLAEMDDYDRDFVLVLLLTGMRSGACKRLRWNMTVNYPKWQEGVIKIIDTEDDEDWTRAETKELVISTELQKLLYSRYKKYGQDSEWVFWQRGNVMRCRKTDYQAHCGIDGGERETFVRLDMPSNEGDRITPHDLRRTFNHLSRSILKIDPLITAILQTQSTKNMSVPDGYMGAKPEDLRRETNRISTKFLEFMRSTPEEIMRELEIELTTVEELDEFVL